MKHVYVVVEGDKPKDHIRLPFEESALVGCIDRVKVVFPFVIGFMLLFFAASTLTSAQTQIQEQSHWGYGYVHTAKAVGTYLFVGDGAVLTIRDNSNPLNPTKISAVDARDDIMDFYADGNYVYMVTESDFRIADISNISNPTVVGNVSPVYHDGTHTSKQYFGRYIAVAGNYAYVAADAYGLAIIDISNKSNPVEVGWMALNKPASLDVSGNNLFVGGYPNITGMGVLEIMNITNPLVPIEISKWNFPSNRSGRAFGIKVNGSHVYIADYGFGVSSINIADLKNPIEESFVGSNVYGENLPRQIAIKNNIAYISYEVSNGGEGIVAFDISNPANLTKRKISTMFDSQILSGYAQDVSINGDFAYLSALYKGAAVYNISSPPNEKIINVVTPRFGRTFKVIENGNYLYLQQDTWLVTLDITDPKNPVLLNISNYFGRGWNMAINGNYLYVTGSPSSLTILDISNPANPSTLSSRKIDGITGSISYSNGYLHAYHLNITYDNLGRKILTNEYVAVNVSDPLNPFIAGTYGNNLSNGRAPAIRVFGQYAYIADGGKFMIFDVSDISNIQLVGSTAIVAASFLSSISLVGNYAYANGANTIQVIDISNKSTPKKVNDVPFTGITEIHNIGNYLIAPGESTTRFYNLSTNPVNLSVDKEYSFTGKIEVTDTYLYLFKGYDGSGLTIYTYSTVPRAPKNAYIDLLTYFYADGNVSYSGPTDGKNATGISALPASGNVSVLANRFNNSFANFSADAAGGNAVFTVGSLKPNANYSIKRDGIPVNTMQADSSGKIVFSSSA